MFKRYEEKLGISHDDFQNNLIFLYNANQINTSSDDLVNTNSIMVTLSLFLPKLKSLLLFELFFFYNIIVFFYNILYKNYL